MRNFLILLACAAAMFVSYSQAHGTLDLDIPLTDVRDGHSLVIRFDEPLSIPAARLKGTVQSLRQESRGSFSFWHGRLIRGEDADRLLEEQSTTICTLVTTGGDFISGPSAVPAVQFSDFHLAGSLPVQEVFVRKYKGPEAIAAILPIDMTGTDPSEVSVREVIIVRSYHGQDEKERAAAMAVTPKALRECLGAHVRVLEVRSAHTAGR